MHGKTSAFIHQLYVKRTPLPDFSEAARCNVVPWKKHSGQALTILILNYFCMIFFSFFFFLSSFPIYLFRLLLINSVSIHIYSDSPIWESHRLCCINRKAKCPSVSVQGLSLRSTKYENYSYPEHYFACKGLGGGNRNPEPCHPWADETVMPLVLPHRASVHKPVEHLPVPSLFIICREVIPLQNSNNSLALIRFPRVHGCTNVCFNCQWLTWDLYALCQWMTRAFPFMLLNTFLTLFACKWLCHPEL